MFEGAGTAGTTPDQIRKSPCLQYCLQDIFSRISPNERGFSGGGKYCNYKAAVGPGRLYGNTHFARQFRSFTRLF